MSGATLTGRSVFVTGAYGLLGGWLVKGWDQIPRFFAYSLPTMMYYSGGLGVLLIMGRAFNVGMFYGLLGLALLAIRRTRSLRAVRAAPKTGRVV